MVCMHHGCTWPEMGALQDNWIRALQAPGQLRRVGSEGCLPALLHSARLPSLHGINQLLRGLAAGLGSAQVRVQAVQETQQAGGVHRLGARVHAVRRGSADRSPCSTQSWGWAPPLPQR